MNLYLIVFMLFMDFIKHLEMLFNHLIWIMPA